MNKQSLIIVESPSKARTIERYLGKEYRVLACNGHIKDLPKSDLGIDIENNFVPRYVVLPEKYKVMKKIKETARQAPQILIATDPDREGEAIAWHLVTELDGKSNKIKRVLFNEITSSGIKSGIQNMRNVDMQLVDSQKARRVIDRIVGFKVSEFLWRVLFNGLSAGRVQSVALRLVCERHQEIIDFKPVEYWTLSVQLKSQKGEVFTAQLHRIQNKKPEITNESEANKIIQYLEDKVFQVSSIRKKLVRKKPYAPFITSTLQQEAAIRLGFSPANTMRIAQKLYEGIDIGDGAPTGLITYMRTDSTRISNEALSQVRNLISTHYGNEYLPKKAAIYTSKKKLVQDAHEAIRPSNPGQIPHDIKNNLGKDEFKLYELIWQWFVASQMTPTVLNQTTIDILAGEHYQFRKQGSMVKFDGFRKVYPMLRRSEDNDTPKYLEEGEVLDRLEFKPEQHFTKP
ncbi:MAG: type I DNA topoisomerase, partial [bacterium]